jgi:hypothetical protein
MHKLPARAIPRPICLVYKMYLLVQSQNCSFKEEKANSGGRDGFFTVKLFFFWHVPILWKGV